MRRLTEGTLASMVWPPPLSEVIAAFDARADSYDKGPMHRWVAAATADLLGVRPNDLILDAAAGTGLAGRRLLEREPSARVVTVDVSAGLLAAGQQADHRLLPVQADLTALPLPDTVLDAAICVSALAYASPPERALAELARVVRPSGQVVVQVWSTGGLLVPRLFRDAAASVGVDLADPNAALGSADLLIAALRAAGLTQIDVSETAWRQSLPTPEDAWTGTVASAVGGPVRALSAEHQLSARRHFLAVMAEELDASTMDVQPLLIATSARP